MTKFFLQLAGIAFLTALTFATIELHYVWLSIITEAGSVAGQAQQVAIGTLLTERAIATNLAANLNAVTGEQGRLAELNATVYTTGRVLGAGVAEMEGDVASLVYGVWNPRTGQSRAGLLDLQTSLAETSGKIGDLAESSTHLTDQFNESWPNIESRYLALTGEGMRTLDSMRIMSNEAKANFPKMLESWNRMADAGAGIAEDGHRFTSKFIAPRPLKSKIWDGVKLGVYGAARAF